MTIPTKRIIILWVTVLLVVTGCGKGFYSATTETGFKHFPKNNKISPERAVELATPYLDQSYKLRIAERTGQYPLDLKIYTYIILEGNFYYITKDYYHHKTIDFYMHHAVKVNKKTGEVIKP